MKMKKAVTSIVLVCLLLIFAAISLFIPGIRDLITDVLFDVGLSEGREFGLTVGVNDETMGSATAGADRAKEGELITLQATPNYGYAFVGWYDGASFVGSSEKIHFPMPNGGANLIAYFAKDVFTLDVRSMNPAFSAASKTDYEYLTDVTISAPEISGYIFAGWYRENMLISNKSEYTHTIVGDATVYAEYYADTIGILSHPVAAPVPHGTRLEDVALVGGKADTLGEFQWMDPSQEVYEGGEYVVSFVPVLDSLTPVSFLVEVPVATKQLPAPVISIANGVLSWKSVEGALGYTVRIGDQTVAVGSDVTSYALPTAIGEYFVSVRADGDDDTLCSSEYSKTIRYVRSPAKEYGFGGKESVYEDGELVKYAGSFVLDPESEGTPSTSSSQLISVTPDAITFSVKMDIAKYLKENTKMEVLKLNEKAMSADAKIEIDFEIVLHNPEFYAEIDMGFPLTIEDLAFGIGYETTTTTAMEILLNGEFVEPQLRRGTLHLLFLDLTGLSEPIYQWDVLEVPIPGTFGLLSVELAVAFDAVGAIAAAAQFQAMEAAEYFVGIQMVEDGVPVFDGEYYRVLKESAQGLYISGETDFDINFLRASASLNINAGKEEISAARLNLDFFNLESDLTGSVYIQDAADTQNPDLHAGLTGSYRLYGQVSFEYYLEISLRFGFLPLDNYSVKLIDGVLVIADWEYLKGGTPKQTYRDEAIHLSTPVSATDGKYFYYKDTDGTLKRAPVGEKYEKSEILAEIEDAEIVDIDNYYLYVLDGNRLRRVGLTGGTERTVVMNVAHVVGSDRTHIYYTVEGEENVVYSYLRMDFEGKARKHLTLPKGYRAIRMRYDYALACEVIYAENKSGEGFYFTYDGIGLGVYADNVHAYWNKISYGDNIVAYYTMEESGDVTDAFIRFPDGGITHDPLVHSIGISPLGLLVVRDNKDDNATLPYVIGLYSVVDGHGRYTKLCEVGDKYAADRVTSEGGISYFVDVASGKLRICKTDGTALYPVVSPTMDVNADRDSLCSAILDDKLFVYTYAKGEVRVIYAIDVQTLAEAPYLSGSAQKVFDKGNPADVPFTMGSSHVIRAIYLSPLSNAELDALKGELADLRASYDAIRKLLKVENDFFATVEGAADRMMQVFEENPGIFSLLSSGRSGSVTLYKEHLSSLSYGVHEGYVITDAGYLPITVKVTDSRIPTPVSTRIPTFDKSAPAYVTYDIKLYENEGDFVGLTEGEDWGVIATRGDVNTVALYPSYLLGLDYGLQTILYEQESGEKFAIHVQIVDSRSPSDSEYAKTFDKTYPADVTFTFDLFDEGYITSVEGNGIAQQHYTVTDNRITIDQSFLMNLTGGTWRFTMQTLEGEMALEITVITSRKPEASCDKEYILGQGTPFTIHYVQNDASAFNVYVNGDLLAAHEYSYDMSGGKLVISDEYVTKYVPYGISEIRIDSYVPSVLGTQTEVAWLTVRVSDTRTPVVNTDFITYEMQQNARDIRIRAELYGLNVNSVKVDGRVISYYMDRVDANGERDYRGGYIVISAQTITRSLSIGMHTITVQIDAQTYEIGLNISDDRSPTALDTEIRFDINKPTSAQFAIGIYEHEILSVLGHEIDPENGDYLLRVFEEDASVRILKISAAFLKSLEPSEGDRIEFTVVTDVNEFTVSVVCYASPIVTPPEGGDGDVVIEYEKYDPPYRPEEQPVAATRPTVSPDNQYFAVTSERDVVYSVHYGENNDFGALQRGYSRLVEGVHYVRTEDGFALKASYLATLPYGEHEFTLYGAKGKSDGFTVTVYDSRSPYLKEEVEFDYDKYVGGSYEFGAVMYDSAVKYVLVGETRYNSGFSSSATLITLTDKILTDLASQKTHTLVIGFNDCDATVSVTVNVFDTGLYFQQTIAVDKSKFADNSEEIEIPWTLYQGSVESVSSETLRVTYYTNTLLNLAGFRTAAYGMHTVDIVANGHTFRLNVRVEDSRAPYMNATVYTFDKATYKYSLDPTVTKNYDMKVKVHLYDETLDGAEVMGNQTLKGNDISYEDYKRTEDTYAISYLYLFRLPVGEYEYSVRTSDGTLTFKVIVTDSHAPQLRGEDPLHYVYNGVEDDESTPEDETVLGGGDMRVPVELFGEPVSSLSYVTFRGTELTALSPDLYYFEENAEGDDVLVIKRAFFEQSDIYANYEYKFRLATTTERTLDFGMYMDGAPERPCTVTFIYTPYHVYPDGTIEPDVTFDTQYLFYGDVPVAPEAPTHDYYNFLGFFTEKEGGVKVDFTKPLEEDINVFPRWEPKTYKLNLYSDGKIYKTFNVKYLDSLASLEIPTKQGYNFIRWTSDEEGSIRFNLDTMPHEDVNVYAQWEIAIYTVIFKDAGGVTLKTEQVEAFKNATPPTDDEMYIDEYHTFLGWDGSYTNILSNRTLTARYETVTWDIVYNLDGGTNPSNAPKKHTIDGGETLPTPTKRGYAFAGWYTDPELTAESRMTIVPAGIDEAITLYAKWEVGTYGVILNNVIDGVEYAYSYPIENDRKSIKYDEIYDLPILKLGNRGYAFLGWFSGENGTGTRYTDLNGNCVRAWNDVQVVQLYPYVVDIVTLTNVVYGKDNSLSFRLNQNVSGDYGIEVESIELIRNYETVDRIESIVGTGNYVFYNLPESVEHEVVVTFSYRLDNMEERFTTTRSFKVRSEERDYVQKVESETLAEIMMKRPNFATYAISSISVKDAFGADYTLAHIFTPAYANQSALHQEDGWVYVTGLKKDSYYVVTISYSYTLVGYAGTYYADMTVPVRTGGTLGGIPQPTLNVSMKEVSSHTIDTGTFTYDEYFTYAWVLSFSDVYLESELSTLRWELLNSAGEYVTGGDYNAYISGNTGAKSYTIPYNCFSNGARYAIRFYYTYNRQRGDGYVEGVVEYEFTFVLRIVHHDTTPCLVEGTEVLMADGTVKNIEDLRVGEQLLVWNFMTGQYDVSPVMFIHKIERDRIFYLTFSDGSTVGVGHEHAFYSLTAEKYVVISDANASDFIGTTFAAMRDGKMVELELVSVEFNNEMQTVYGIATASHYNHFANGFISAIPLVELLNMFEFDGLGYDMEQLAADIERYGILSYEDCADTVTYEQYLALNGPYMSVTIGKGLATLEELKSLVTRYFPELELM